MNRQCELDEFVTRAMEFLRPIVESYVDPHIIGMRKYNNSEKGKERLAVGWKLRRKRMVEASYETSLEEIKQIKQFYKDRPDGYHVDHIVPISRGGKHKMENLRYVTREENAKKYNKMLDELIN